MADDPELAAIRARRLAELSRVSTEGSQRPSPQSQQQEAVRREQEEQGRRDVLAKILTADARERLLRIAMVKAERARALEDMLINAARMGQLRGSSPIGQVTESDLVALLERLNQQEGGRDSGKIRFQRRGLIDEDSDE